MALFELVIGLLFLGALFTLWAERISIPYPALLAFVGAVIALVPGGPTVELDPALALALFVAPTLLDSAYDASPRDLRRNLAPIVSFAVVMVVLTVAAVAWTLRLVSPEISWAAAITLGAIVAPPDASAAAAVLKKLQLPHGLLVILEGESLFNDATALLIYRVAVGAAMTGVFSGWQVLPLLLLTCGGGVVAGWIIARLQIWLTSRVSDISVAVLLQFVGTFAAWLLAEHIGLSAIITVVTYAMTIARRVAGRMHARYRIASYAVWDVAVLVLNVLAFVLIGLQLRGILARVHSEDWDRYAICASSVCAAIIAVRVAWVLTHAAFERWRMTRANGSLSARTPPTMQSALLASWCGMRGIVTLAAALALPADFPSRDIIVFCSFCVVLCTLMLQGASLRVLIQRLGLRDDGMVAREIEVARAETARAALRVLEQDSDYSGADALRREFESRVQAARADGAPDRLLDERVQAASRTRHQLVLAQRETLLSLRARDVIGDDAFHALEEEIDLLELGGSARTLVEVP